MRLNYHIYYINGRFTVATIIPLLNNSCYDIIYTTYVTAFKENDTDIESMSEHMGFVMNLQMSGSPNQ